MYGCTAEVLAVRDPTVQGEKETAEVALFISLEHPRAAVVEAVASAELYKSLARNKRPRVQLLSVANLLNGSPCGSLPTTSQT